MASVLSEERRSINDIPENILLEIFKYLPIKSLCTIGRVCRQWRRITNDNSLWRDVNLLPYKLDLNRMWKVIRAHFSEVLLSLRLRGYMDPAGRNWKKNSLSDAMLRDLQDRCPNLSDLQLVMVNLSSVSSSRLPSKLRSLTIIQSLIPAGWFKEAVSKGVLNDLTHLDLSLSTRTCDQDLSDLSPLVNLGVLRLNGCYRVGSKGLSVVSQHLQSLNELAISNTRCDSIAIHQICRSLRKVRVLDISHCDLLEAGDYANIGSSLKLLHTLRVQNSKHVDKNIIIGYQSLENLRILDISGTSVEKECSHEELAALLPDTKVI